MTPDRKGGGLAASLGLKPKAAKSEAEGDYESAKADAGSRVMSAMKSGDAEAFTSALSDFVELCSGGPSASEEEAEEM
jgi:hypothetical protein